MTLTLGYFLRVLLAMNPAGYDPAVADVVTDSREVQPGSLFVAIPGERVDGHDYVAHAFARGAVAALVSRPVPGDWPVVNADPAGLAALQPGSNCLLLVDDTVAAMQQAAQVWREQFQSLRVIGITGSVGKTSTKELTHAVLASRYNTFKTPGNRNSILGLPPALFGLQPGHERAVLEMGMYTRGEIARLCQISRPEIGVITMIDAVHMERAGSLEHIVAAKRELVEALPADGVAILNRDEPLVMGMAGHTAARVFTYGLDPAADLWADGIESRGLNGIQFTLHTGREALRLQVPLLGRHSVHTVLRAAAVGLIEGLTWDEIGHGLQGMQSQLRLVTADGPQQSLILDDTYNASPASMIAALNLLADLDGRRVAVLGDMLELGQAEDASHRLVGRRALQVAHLLVTVGPRGRLIAEEALLAGMDPGRVYAPATAAEAVALLLEIIRPRDVILVKGSRAVFMDQIVSALVRAGESSQ